MKKIIKIVVNIKREVSEKKVIIDKLKKHLYHCVIKKLSFKQYHRKQCLVVKSPYTCLLNNAGAIHMLVHAKDKPTIIFIIIFNI